MIYAGLAALLTSRQADAKPARPAGAASRPVPKASQRYRTVVAHGRGDGQDGQRKLDATSPGFATAIDLQRDAGRPADSLPEVLGRSAGATVRSLGGLGQFSALSLRGSTAQQVGVFLDGVPVGGSGGVVNLGDLPIDTLGRATVHRGLVPVVYGGAAIGGALDLGSDLRCIHDRRRFSATLGVGSFASREARASASVPLASRRRGPCLDVRVGYGGSAGDFPFHNVGDTLQDKRDDTTVRRQNNHYERVLTQLAVHGRIGAWRYSAQELLLIKRQGIPGQGTGQQARATGLDTLVARSVARLRRDFAAAHYTELLVGFAVDRSRWRDPLGEVGLGVDDQVTRNLDLYLSPRVHLGLWRGAILTTIADARQEWTRVDQRSLPAPRGDARRQRVGIGIGAQLDQRLLDGRLHLQPIARLDLVTSRFAVPAGSGEQDDRGANHLDIGFSPRLGARLEVLPGVSLRLTGGRYFRPPTLFELFGDRGYIVGNEALRPERGTSIDGGVVIDTGGARTSLYAHAAGFVAWSDRLIQWQQSGPTLRPVNLEGARVSGLETSAALRLLGGDLRLTANYTLLATTNLGDDPSQRGQPLPGRPRHELYAQASLGHAFKKTPTSTELAPRVFYTVEHAARTFLDPSGRYEVPRRTLHAVGVELRVARRVHLTAEVRNLFNLRTTLWHPPIAGSPAITVPVSDFFFYPLPGTSLWTSLRVDLDLPVRRRA